jgi:hypothetical protein
MSTLTKIDANELLAKSLEKNNIHLSVLVAETSLWAHPDVHNNRLADTGSAAMFPKVRRARAGHNEKRGETVNEIKFDDNTYANNAIKRACGLKRKAVIGFEACHIWPLTCYDERYHTAIANIVLLPRALASLSDHNDEIKKSLQYRAFELYNWKPDGVPDLVKPNFYPTSWSAPQPDPDCRASQPEKTSSHKRSHKVKDAAGSVPSVNSDDPTSQELDRELSDRIKNWAKKPELNVHKIIALVAARQHSPFNRDELITEAEKVTKSKNPAGAIASLQTNSGNAYGKAFIAEGENILIHPDVRTLVSSLKWKVE